MNHDFGSHFFQRDPYVWWEESKTPTAQVEAGLVPAKKQPRTKRVREGVETTQMH